MATPSVSILGSKLLPSEADAAWAIGNPIRVVSPALDRVIRNPRPVSSNDLEAISAEQRMTRGKEMFPQIEFYTA